MSDESHTGVSLTTGELTKRSPSSGQLKKAATVEITAADEVYDRDEDTKAIVDVSSLHTGIKQVSEFLNVTRHVVPCDEQTTDQFATIGSADAASEAPVGRRYGSIIQTALAGVSKRASGVSKQPSELGSTKSLPTKIKKWHTICTLKEKGQEEQPAVFQLISAANGGSGKLVDLIETHDKEPASEKLSQEATAEINKLLDEPCDGEVSIEEGESYDVSMIREEVKKPGGMKWKHVLLHGRGRLGETCLHLCFLVAANPNIRKLIGYLVGTYAKETVLQRMPQQDGLRRNDGKTDKGKAFEWVPFTDASFTAQPYYGEVCLHIAIANGSLPLVKLLVENGASILAPHAAGLFFYRSPTICSVLGLAVALGLAEVVDYLLEKLDAKMDKQQANPAIMDATMEEASGIRSNSLRKASTRKLAVVVAEKLTPDWQDSTKDLGALSERLSQREKTVAKQLLGNNVLHIAVTHNQVALVRKLVERGANMNEENDETKLNALDYACLVGSREMAEVCVRLCSSLVWEWGPIRCRQYDLRRFFKAMIICTQQSRGDVLQLEQFEMLLSDRWESYARLTYEFHFFEQFFVCVCLVLLMPWYPQDLGVHNFHKSLYIILLPQTFYSLYADMLVVIQMRVLRVLPKPVGPHAPSWLRGLSQRLHFNSHPHLLVNLFFSWSFAISFIVGMSTHFVKGVGSETETTASTGVAAFFAWLRLTNYLRVTKTFGPFVISIGTCVTELFKRWALVACFVFMAFACIIASLQSDMSDWKGDAGRPTAFVLMLFSAMIGELDFDTLRENEIEEYAVATLFLYVVFTMLMALLLINLLIAMITEGYDEIQKDAAEKLMLARARGILAYTLLLGPMELAQLMGFSPGRKRPHHHVQVNIGDEAGNRRWLMMLEELDDSLFPDAQASTKKNVARLAEGQKRLEKKLDLLVLDLQAAKGKA